MPRLCLDCGELYLDNSQTRCNHCNSTNTEIVNSSMTLGEYFNICNISKDGKFIKAMMELYDTNPIEYQLKIQQFTNQTQNHNNVPKCPHCNSINIKPIGTGERIGSVMMLGMFSKKINKSFKCLDCKYTW